MPCLAHFTCSIKVHTSSQSLIFFYTFFLFFSLFPVLSAQFFKSASMARSFVSLNAPSPYPNLMTTEASLVNTQLNALPTTYIIQSKTPQFPTSIIPFLQITFKKIFILLLCVLIIAGTLVGNSLICFSVALVKRLQTPSNLLIVSLTLADLLIAILVMPLALMMEMTGEWSLGQRLCDAWTCLDVFLCTASILNLCVIGIDRYLAITRPFKWVKLMHLKHVLNKIKFFILIKN